jgi:RNA polymerase sigma factor (sigma-70 family)
MRVPPQTSPGATADVGLQFIDRYARTCVNHEYRTRRVPSGVHRDDLIIEVHIALCETLGSAYAEQIGKAFSERFQGESNVDLRRTLRQCVRRGIGRPQWASRRRLQRERSRGRHLPRVEALGSTPIASPPEAIDEAIDLASILESFDEQRQVIWEALVAGHTLREIGSKLGLSHQQVQRRSLEVLNRVARYFEIAG